MERLTFEGNFCEISQCRNVPGGSFCEDGACYQKKVWERLKQFEDTVRAPELFFKMYGELPLLESALKHYGSHDRMKELAEADKDGRLKAYEDTGLTPERCAEFARADAEGRYIVMRDAEQEGVARLRELAEADKDGRVVVLPCKVGDKLYRVFAGEIFEHRVGSMKYFAIQGKWDIETSPFCPCVESSIGKTIFLTREEAEKALAEMEDTK